MKPQSKQAMVTDIKKSIQNMIRKVFNSEVFGTYEGIIESIDDTTAIMNVSVPSLNNLVFENCRVMTPCLSDASYILPTFNVGDHVIVSCADFKLGKPVVIGQIRDPAEVINLHSDSIYIKNGAGSIVMDPDGNIIISGTSIKMYGDIIEAEGEDLTDDDVGIA